MIIELIELDEPVQGKREPSWEIVRAFKGRVSYFIRRLPERPWFAWQSRTYESLLLTERYLNHAREYIRTNPQRWDQDPFHKRF
jgi:REP element-mobilizing transposase RayT